MVAGSAVNDAGPMLEKLRYVYEDLDRHGNVRIYVWLGKGHKKHRIRESPGTPAFRTAYDEALAKAMSPEQEPEAARGPRQIVPGTYRWMCVRYFKECVEFQKLAPVSRKNRRSILEHTFEEPIAPGAKELFADFPLSRMTARVVKILRDRKAATPDAANSRIKILRRVFAWALEEEIEGVTGNPAKEVAYFKTGGDGWHTWTESEVEQFEKRHPIGTKAYLAMALLLYTGVRRSDVVGLGRQMVRKGWLHFTEVKGRTQLVKDRAIPILPQLQAAIDAFPSENMTFLVTEYGAPFTGNGFGNWFRDRCNEAGLPHCTAHGLRKAGATIAADNGATEHQLMAIFGWESPKQAAHYTRKANRKKLAGAAMHLVVPVKS